MIKLTTILLLFALLFTGCLEKGHTLKPIKVETTSDTKNLNKQVKIKTAHSTKKVIKKKQMATSKKVLLKEELLKQDNSLKSNKTKVDIIVESDTKKIDNTFFSSISEKTKNNISGFFIIIIGIIILL